MHLSSPLRAKSPLPSTNNYLILIKYKTKTIPDIIDKTRLFIFTYKYHVLVIMLVWYRPTYLHFSGDAIIVLQKFQHLSFSIHI